MPLQCVSSTLPFQKSSSVRWMSLLSDAEKTSLPRQDCTNGEAFVKACLFFRNIRTGRFRTGRFRTGRFRVISSNGSLALATWACQLPYETKWVDTREHPCSGGRFASLKMHFMPELRAISKLSASRFVRTTSMPSGLLALSVLLFP